MIEKPIERLNFINGERLKADDLKLEQEYHMRVQRWVNKSLYSAGIAAGLEVNAEPGRVDAKGRLVILVSPGLALDGEGREMILVEQAEVPIMGKPNKVGDPIPGNFLYIQYHEEKRSEESENCPPGGNGKGQLAWGGPTRVRATPVLGWSNAFPIESSGKVVLAQVELDDADCSVRHVHTYPRRYIGPASNAMVRQYALEGERHIDKDNPGRIYFHIRGRQPNAVTLYLRADKFSTLFYTELGNHNHAIGVNLDPISIPVHSHTLTAIKLSSDLNNTDPPVTGSTSDVGTHTHAYDDIRAQSTEVLDPTAWHHSIDIDAHKPGRNDGFDQKDQSLSQWTNLRFNILGDGAHNHRIPSTTELNSQPAPISLTGSGTPKPAGVTDQRARSHIVNDVETEKSLKYVDDLQIYIGMMNVDGSRPLDPGLATNGNFKNEILAQLKNTQPIYRLRQKLGEGNGDPNDPLYNNGTGPIRLDLLSPNLSFPEGEYYIELAVTSGGGRILYNLYVE